MSKEEHFFDFAAEVGLTKHIGGVEATDKLAELCQINRGSLVLDVGCGAGVTPSYLAGKYGCRVVGVDILPKMIERSRERAHRSGVSDQVEFRVADAQDLPFDNEHFDAVITESVTAFPKDKHKAVGEYARVTKPGGFVGLNETTWLKVPPPPEVIAWARQDIGAAVEPLTPQGWQELLVQAGLQDVVVILSEVDIKNEARGILQRYGFSMVRTLARTLRLYLRNPNYRSFVKGVNQRGLAPENLTEYLGYGIFVARKPSEPGQD